MLKTLSLCIISRLIHKWRNNVFSWMSKYYKYFYKNFKILWDLNKTEPAIGNRRLRRMYVSCVIYPLTLPFTEKQAFYTKRSGMICS
jgi:hypothetical protein